MKLRRAGGEVVSRRRSPKQARCSMCSRSWSTSRACFPHRRLTLEVLLIEIEEWRYPATAGGAGGATTITRSKTSSSSKCTSVHAIPHRRRSVPPAAAPVAAAVSHRPPRRRPRRRALDRPADGLLPSRNAALSNRSASSAARGSTKQPPQKPRDIGRPCGNLVKCTNLHFTNS